MKTKLTIPISAPHQSAVLNQTQKAIDLGAQMLELRMDYIENLNIDLAEDILHSVRKAVSLPLIVTCRDVREGGENEYALELRRDVLISAIQAGADFVDLEFTNFHDRSVSGPLLDALAKCNNARLILSAHNFEGPFADLQGIYRSIKARCPDAVPKIVYTAHHINDCFNAFDLLYEKKGALIVLCMGEAGMISRILAGKLGGMISFASLDTGSETAPGQITIDQLKNHYRFSEIQPDTQLFGVIADPVGHSLSPAVHNACFTAEKMNRRYLPLLVGGGEDEFAQFLDNIISRQWLHFRGFSVTLPHKQHALTITRARNGTVEDLALKIGAANTLIIHKTKKLLAFNTDYQGAMDAVINGLSIEPPDLHGRNTVIIGAGGVAHAVTAALKSAGCRITICNRTETGARTLAERFDCDYVPMKKLDLQHTDLLVNCTSVGMTPETKRAPVPKEQLHGSMAVFDTIYTPIQTQLLKLAGQANATAIDGLSMFVYQAVAQFKHFTGQDPNVKLIRKVAEKHL